MPAAPPFPNLVIAHLEGRARATLYRQTQLWRLQKELLKDKAEIKNAIGADYGHTAAEIDFEYALILAELHEHYEALESKHEIRAARQIEFGSNNAARTRNTSVVYIVPSTHTTFFSALSPLCAAIAAGSCAILELPQNLRGVTAILRRVLVSTLDNDTFAISERRPTDADFLRHCIIVEQSQPQKPLQPASECTSPSSFRVLAIVDRTAAIDEAARTITQARFSRRGTSSYAPDVVLVNEFVLEEFVGRLLHHVSPYIARENGLPGKVSTKQKPQRRHANDQDSILKVAEESDTIRVVVRGSNGGIISVQDRSNSLLKQKVDCPVLIVHAITSLDDAIDFANQSESMYGSMPLAASFVFASLAPANYLSNFIDARLSCVNHIPAELLVGPLCPTTYAPSLSPRYTRAMFEELRPQFLHKTSLTKTMQTTGEVSFTPHARLAEFEKSMTVPLPAIQRFEGKDVDFFAQALMTGAATVVFPLLIGAGLLVTGGLRYLKS